jgi:AcrR family transcriptional regulator
VTTPPKRPSKPKARANYHHGDLARELVEASLAILGEVGAEGLSLREAARRAGVNHRAVYRHYADKRALLAAIAEGGYRVLRSEMEEAVRAAAGSDAGPARARRTLVAIAEAYLRFALREPARFQVMFGPRLNRDERFPSMEQAIQELVAVLYAELKAAGPDAASVVLRDRGISLWSTMHGMSSLVLAGRIALRSTHVRSYVAKVIEPVVDGILQSLA